MVEHATKHQNPETDTALKPELSLVETGRFPDIEFNLPRDKFINGDSVLEANDTTRTNYVMRQLSGAAPEVEYPSGNLRHKHQGRIISYLGQTVTIKNTELADSAASYKTPKTIKTKRSKILNEDGRRKAEELALAELAKVNHPTAQIFKQIDEKFGDEFPASDRIALRRNVLEISHWKLLRDIFSQVIDSKRA